MQSYDCPRRRARVLLLLICAIVILTTGQLFASERHQDTQNEPRSSITKRKSSSVRQYCGLYCLYAVMRLAGKQTDFLELTKPDYVGSPSGSSLAELKKAAEDHGLYAIPVGKLTDRELHNCRHPIILHVKPGLQSQLYTHYELFLGTENGQAKLFDPPNPVRLVPFRELAPRWDGNGLIISAEPIDLSSVFGPTRKRLIMYAAAAIAVILALHWAKRLLPETLLNSRIKLMGLSITQAAGFAILALFVGMFYHFADDEGLLANAKATSAIQQAHAANFIPKIGERKVHKLLGSDAVFIDARFARDYKAGHLEGAISVPVDANDVELQKVTADIPKDSRIVMYCQSSGCKYAEIVAIKLIKDDYSNISIFRGGWAEWKAKNGKNKRL